ncbi:MAG TPA: molybdopterin converting factor subunit 1 [Sulfurihydrogenibium sp.]|uniref:molybdopterin converting factor subunit 1 n=1 Tax=Sulfurihydrogenibium sp. (strain YO3AOP1) TaxID=436114 RepID=UPI0001722DBD|nr:molybdopterin converting factor subunit 1 [Sulfurihydrogenibium sp. YO3AOP1]ACD65870.1 molybdopterin converting factor, subunit 1 [Sulfurihydrogenibium sp. YO3AOP1]HBT99115.1 molybdopterin converting factor subunit 1 [Sulfurihydrogenibium sp.]
MKVKVLYFSQVKDKIGKNEEEIEFEGKTLKDLVDVLAKKYPDIKEILKRSMFAVNESYETMDYNLQDNDMIAIIPPVSGG